jgi:hypothetical protein
MAYQGHKVEGVNTGPGATNHCLICFTACGRELKVVTRNRLSRKWDGVECKACLALKESE